MTRLLIVDDSPLMRRLLTEIFEEAGDFEIEIARNAEEALASLGRFMPDVITLDIHMPGMDGLACLDRIMVERPTPVVMLSSLTAAGADETLEALALGAVDFITKPRGAISLEIEGIVSDLVEKVRGAASARMSRSVRLTERVRQRAQDATVKGGRKPASAERATKPGLVKPARAKRSNLDTEKLTGIEVVLVGISTGGPPALDALLPSLPGDFPWPIVIAQHMPASFTGPLARRLDKACSLNVVEVSRPVPLEPGTIYIGRGDTDLIIARRGGRAHVMAAPIQPERTWHPSADRLVESARAVFPADAIVGLLMTGMGYDGASSMAQLQRDGGHVLAQDKDSSVVWGMPGALVAQQGADLVLPLDQLSAQLNLWARP
ncbi:MULTISPECIES: chemotaxis-specific protein-glutamate methyltransferase CheB [Sphingobium]|uniref:chemotaxis-specific protein-glutamate methyltransferase CheB n=1 Tax=Sphingobium TaxID=165695 RepID=UPI001BE68A90|nr:MULTISPECIES: chemotaxis-specific protein-glutamate methyltransferase CheB [Sphingobium]MBT2246108.1 chemotaxis-specific protein-glutamate methyltransferase CheB [Sphingobium sp. BHU LFT2]WBQ19050.1 chemotaxis-specific protein-glutamate methyltransferase CheB [Sphingobium yanoikuyae]